MNAKLALGLALLCALAILAAFPDAFTPWPKDYRDSIRVLEGPDGQQWLYAPEAPSGYFPFGSDPFGYDVLTKTLWGLRWTLACVLFTAALKTLLGGSLGILRAVLKLGAGRDRGFSPLSGIPSFVMVFFLIYPVTINSALGSARLFIYQCLVMTVFDLGGIIASVAAKTSNLMATPFVESAVTSGARAGWIIRRHVMPFLGEELLENFAEQTVAVLKLAGRLGVFMMFIGGTTLTYDPPILTSTTGEIAGLIGLYRGRLLTSRWLLAYPLGTYLIVLTAFRLFSSGLRERERRRRRVLG